MKDYLNTIALKKFYLFIFDCAGFSLLLEFPLVAASSGLLSSCGAQASHCGGFSCCRSWALGMWASVVAARGLIVVTCGL